MTFDPLNTARTAFYDLTPDDHKAILALEAKGLQVQFIRMSDGYWADTNKGIQSTVAVYRICPRALALHEIRQLPGKGPAIRKARDIVRGALG